MKLSVDHNTAHLQRLLKLAPKKVRHIVDQVLLKYALKISRKAQRNSPKAFSQLRNSILVSQLGVADYEINSGTNYARYVEEGSDEGGKPTIDSLVDWIRVKRIEPDDPYMEEEELAYLIQRAIGRSGTPAQPFMVPAYDSFRDRIVPAMRNQLEKELVL